MRGNQQTMRKEIADDGMMEEERILDFGFDNFLRFLISLSTRWKDDDNFEAERGKENSDIRLLMN